MDNHELLKYIDHHRWLLNNGMMNDQIKNQLYLYGSMLHKDVRALEVDIDPGSRNISYVIYVSNKLIKKLEKYEKLSKSDSLWGLWRFRSLLKKEGNLNFKIILKKFIKDYCGPNWSTSVKVTSIDTYVDGYENEEENEKTS